MVRRGPNAREVKSQKSEVRLFVSPEQRFTCAQCGRCCHRTTVPITADEAAALRAAGAAEWFDEDQTQGKLRVKSQKCGCLSRPSSGSRARSADAAVIGRPFRSRPMKPPGFVRPVQRNGSTRTRLN